MASVATGLDVLARERFARLAGRRIGVICNPTSVDRRLRHLADLLHETAGVRLAALFGPEHGIRADAQDLESVQQSVDARTGVRVHSLYGSEEASLTPTSEQLDGLDLLIFDIQDVGSRYYTFAATMFYAMKAAAAQGIGFLVLDRPNPIGGVEVEGPTVVAGHQSFISAYPMPIRHGLTVGELALLFRSELGLDLELEVVPCEGWRRDRYWEDTGLPWVMPSPNMPTPETALVYPGGCLIEGTNLSEGRGTTRPFELWGAPWLDPYKLAGAMERATAGVCILRPCAFRPTFHKHQGDLCFGVQVHVVDRERFRPVWLYSALVAQARAQSPERFDWRREPYEFVSDPIAIDLLWGSPRERLLIETGDLSIWETPDCGRGAFLDAWRRDEAEFLKRREPFLLYG